jgi:hypothetical protein
MCSNFNVPTNIAPKHTILGGMLAHSATTHLSTLRALRGFAMTCARHHDVSAVVGEILCDKVTMLLAVTAGSM